MAAPSLLASPTAVRLRDVSLLRLPVKSASVLEIAFYRTLLNVKVVFSNTLYMYVHVHVRSML